MDNQVFFIGSIIVFFIGAGCLSLSKIVYRMRAVMNKPAWGGSTLPLLFLGVPLTAVGIGLIYLFYPFQ